MRRPEAEFGDGFFFFLRSEALRKGNPKEIIILRQSHLLLWESTKAFGQHLSKMGLVLWLERVRTSAHQGVQSEVANEALWHGGWPQSPPHSPPLGFSVMYPIRKPRDGGGSGTPGDSPAPTLAQGLPHLGTKLDKNTNTY